MLIFDTQGKITVDNNKTNIVHSFNVPKDIKALKIKYSYSPKTILDEKTAVRIVENCLKKYKVDDDNIDKYLPVKNLITLSLDDSSSYRGAGHRQSNEQEHIISENFASNGFIKGKINAGTWNIVQNVHYVGCEIDYIITVEGITEREVE